MRFLLGLLLCWLLPTAARAAWREASTPHFLIYSEESAESLKSFATRLESFDFAMRRLRNLPDPPLGPNNRLTIYVVSDVGDVQKIAGRGRNIAGLYIPRAGGSIAIVPRRSGTGDIRDLDAESILFHEYTHHFMLAEAAGFAYPSWLIEGFAEFNSTADFGKDGSISLGLPAGHRAYGLSLGFPIEKLLGGSADWKDGQTAEAFYGRSWLLTHYLTFEPSRRGQLSAYLRALNGGKSSLDAARDAFGDLKTLDSELGKYLKRGRLPGRQYTFAELKVPPIHVRQLRPAEDALMDLRIRSDRGVDQNEAKLVLAGMRKLAAGHPADPAAQAFLAEAEYDAGNHAEAIAAADRALAADPKTIDALIYRGRAAMAKAVADKNADPAAWKEIRGWFLKANKLDPEHAEPLWLFYQSFRAAGAAPSGNAVAGLIKAHDLAPQDRTLRMAVARQYLVDGKAAEAKTALAPIAYDPHGGASAKLAATLISLLSASDAKAALRALESGPGKAESPTP